MKRRENPDRAPHGISIEDFRSQERGRLTFPNLNPNLNRYYANSQSSQDRHASCDSHASLVLAALFPHRASNDRERTENRVRRAILHNERMFLTRDAAGLTRAGILSPGRT